MPPEDLSAVVAGNTSFALKTFPLLDTNPNHNTFFSPYSITQVFSGLTLGARGATLREIERTLSFPLQQDRFIPALKKLDFLISGKTDGKAYLYDYHKPKLNKSNTVWIEKSFPILPGYLDTLTINYGADIHLIDFKNDTENSRRKINAWVAQQTQNKIRDIVPINGISYDTRLLITNAIWFKANWASRFSDLNTAKRTFYNRNGLLTFIPFMKQKFVAPYAKVNGCQAIDIAYEHDELSMLIIMPDSGNLRSSNLYSEFDLFLSALSPNLLTEIENHLSIREVDFSMPKFFFTGASNMAQILTHLGMTEAFDRTRADFSGISGSRDLYVKDVFHQAFISINEDGTEAAAATIPSFTLLGMKHAPPPIVTLTIDHPFIFLIRERETGLILFMGKVVSL